MTVVVAAAVELLLMAVAIVYVAGVEAMEVIRRFMITTVGGKTTVIAVAGIIGVVHIAVEVGRAVEPATSTDEDAAIEPLWAVVAVGGAVIGRVVVVAVWADRWAADVYAEGNLGLCCRCRGEKEPSGDGRCSEKRLETTHGETSVLVTKKQISRKTL